MSARILSILLLLFLLCSVTAAALPIPEDAAAPVAAFPAEEDPLLRGVFLTGVPDNCTLRCGSRTLRPGDALTAAQLAEASLVPQTAGEVQAVLTFLPIYDDRVGSEETRCFTLGSRNRPPETGDQDFRTYKNIPVEGTLRCEDPEGERVILMLTEAPKRGDVELRADGSFTYIPKKNKVGTDTFTYTAEDEAGNASPPATVTIRIQKPVIRGTFADMAGDPQERDALFLRSAGLFSGEEIGGVLCFCPEKEVSSGEFLMMVMRLAGLAPEVADGEDWFLPWQSAALRAGLPADYDPDSPLTRSGAAALLAAVLRIEPEGSVLTAESLEPTALRLETLRDAGLPCFTGSGSERMTRRDVAVLLSAADCYCAANQLSFPWAVKNR